MQHPDFRNEDQSTSTIAQTIRTLARSYKQLIETYLTVHFKQLPVLRLAPISEGLFAGHYRKHWPSITFNAYAAAFTILEPAQQQSIRACRVVFCIQNSSDTQAYIDALQNMLTPKPQPQQTTNATASALNHTITIDDDQNGDEAPRFRADTLALLPQLPADDSHNVPTDFDPHGTSGHEESNAAIPHTPHAEDVNMPDAGKNGGTRC